MDRSKFLSKVMGIYLLIVSIAMLSNLNRFYVLVNNLINDPTLMFVCGFFVVIVGVLLVVSHSVWAWNWRLLVTILCWLTLLKGIALLFSPQFLYDMTNQFITNTTYAYIGGLLDLTLGLVLIYFGYRRKD